MTVRCKTPKCGKEHVFTPPTEGGAGKAQQPRAGIVITCEVCRQTYMYSLKN